MYTNRFTDAIHTKPVTKISKIRKLSLTHLIALPHELHEPRDEFLLLGAVLVSLLRLPLGHQQPDLSVIFTFTVKVKI